MDSNSKPRNAFDVAEILVYDRVLSPADHFRVRLLALFGRFSFLLLLAFISVWHKTTPFLLVLLCSLSHDTHFQQVETYLHERHLSVLATSQFQDLDAISSQSEVCSSAYDGDVAVVACNPGEAIR